MAFAGEMWTGTTNSVRGKVEGNVFVLLSLDDAVVESVLDELIKKLAKLVVSALPVDPAQAYTGQDLVSDMTGLSGNSRATARQRRKYKEVLLPIKEWVASEYPFGFGKSFSGSKLSVAEETALLNDYVYQGKEERGELRRFVVERRFAERYAHFEAMIKSDADRIDETTAGIRLEELLRGKATDAEIAKELDLSTFAYG